MSRQDVPSGGTAGTPDRSAAAEPLEGVLDGVALPESEDDMTLAPLTDALGAPGRPDELAREAATVAAFVAVRAEVAASAEPGPSTSDADAVLVGAAVTDLATRRRPAVVAATAVAAVLASVALVGTAAAAITGALPAPLQRWAHDVVGAPAPADDESASAARGSAGGGSAAGTLRTSAGTRAGTPVGPSAGPSAPAVVGLCRAFQDKASAPAAGSTAYAALAAAAKAKGLSVSAYCAQVLATAGPTSQPSRPSTPPGQSNKPTAKPTHTAAAPNVRPTRTPAAPTQKATPDKPTPQSTKSSARQGSGKAQSKPAGS